MPQGVKAIIYDDNGLLFFLILHNKLSDTWEFLKGKIAEGESPESALKRELAGKIGLRKYTVTKHFSVEDQGEYQNNFFLVETSMNTPVRLSTSPSFACNTYLWAKEDRLRDQLGEADKPVFERAVVELKGNHKEAEGFQFH
jgi:8-oxo-dGTP pyrophosphatase MutT (NUDIX family)